MTSLLTCLSLFIFLASSQSILLSGWPTRCYLYTSQQSCSDDVSCIWACGGCRGKEKVISLTLNRTLVADCPASQASWSNCTDFACNECFNNGCLYKQCGYDPGALFTNNTVQSCNAINAPCFYCTFMDQPGGMCSTKFTECETYKNNLFGICSALDCVNDPRYNGGANYLSPSEKNGIVAARVIASFFSLFGTAIAMVCICVFMQLKKMTGRLIFFLLLCNFGESIANLITIGVFNNEMRLYKSCIFQGAMSQFFEVASFCWISVIAIDMFLVVVLQVTNKKREFAYHVFVWLFCIFVTATPFSTHSYGIAGVWCWMNFTTGQPWRWAVYYIPLIFLLVLVIVVYAIVFYTVVTQLQNREDKDALKLLMLKLVAYPLIFWFCYIFAIINRFHDVVFSDESFVLFLLQSIFTPLNGFLNSIAYGLGPEMRKNYKTVLYKAGCCVQWTAPSQSDLVDTEEVDV